MAQEIELKFIVNHSAVEALRDHLNTLGGEHHDPVQLLNIYYETPDNWLRRNLYRKILRRRRIYADSADQREQRTVNLFFIAPEKVLT